MRATAESIPTADGTPPITASLPTLTFSRFPLDLEIELSLGPAPTYELILTVVGRYQDVVAIIESPLTRDADHVVIDSRWYPFARGTLDNVRRALKETGVSNNGPITLRQYLEVRRLPEASATVVDTTPEGKGRPTPMADAPGAAASPPGFRGALYPYQIDGWRWLSFVSGHGLGGILADEMGLGKSVQVICLLLEEKHHGANPSLIITTATLLENWRREFLKFAPGLQTIIHQGADRTGFPSVLRSFDVTITSYETVVRDLPILKMTPWNVLVLDEAQAIKNPSAQRTNAAKHLPRRVGLAVTGTPLENRLTDLWSLSDFVIPGFLGDLATFAARYPDSDTNAEVLERMITPLLLRRRVPEVAGDLPPRIEIPQVLELDESGSHAYDALRNELSPPNSSSISLGSITNLRMYCAHPFLLDDTGEDPLACSPKLARLLELLEETSANDEKAIVFTSFTKMIDIITSQASSRLRILTDFIDGRVPVPERQRIVDRLSASKGPGVLVLNPRAAGTGLNIASANHVIHYTLEWNPAVEDQASARAHRLGQTRPVMIYRLLYRGTVEEVIDQRLARKRELAERAVVGTRQLDDDGADLLRALRASPVRRD